jgi:hypothetical protein
VSAWRIKELSNTTVFVSVNSSPAILTGDFFPRFEMSRLIRLPWTVGRVDQRSVEALRLQAPVAPDVDLAAFPVAAPVRVILSIADHFSPVWLRAPMPFAAFPQSHVATGAETRGTICKWQGGDLGEWEPSASQDLCGLAAHGLNFHAPVIPVLSQRFQLSGRTMADDGWWRDPGAWLPAATGAQQPDDAGDDRQNDQQEPSLYHAFIL